ncbi:MAG: phage scaffolding protein [Gordonibacter sp.]
MTFEEYLKSKGLTDEQIADITGGMKGEKLYLSAEENIDERYGKLKGQHDDASSQLTAAQALIAQLKPQAEGNEALQAQVADYEQKITDAEARAAKAEREAAIKVELLAKGAVPDDVDYLMYRLEGSDTEVKLGGDGKLSGLDEAVVVLKTQCPKQFAASAEPGFKGSPLPKAAGGGEPGITKEQFGRMNLSERTKLYNENRETYDALAGKTTVKEG